MNGADLAKLEKLRMGEIEEVSLLPQKNSYNPWHPCGQEEYKNASQLFLTLIRHLTFLFVYFSTAEKMLLVQFS